MRDQVRSDLELFDNSDGPAWAALPPEAADVLRPALPGLANEIVEAIGREVDQYRRPLEGMFGRTVRLGVEIALSRLLDLIADPSKADQPGRQTYVELGRGEFRQGRALDALLAAYRVGARLSWRRFVEAGVAGGLEPVVLYRLGETIFAYIDAISAESVEGYAAEQSVAASERQRRRRRLVALLAQDPPPEEEAARAAADAAGWTLPATLAALVSDVPAPDALATRIGPDTIAASLDDLVVVLVPDPAGPGRRAQLEAAAGAGPAGLGPVVGWVDARRSVDRARLAHRLALEGVLPSTGLVVADEHLPALMLHGDPAKARDLAARELAPLADVPAAARERLEATLRAWLDRRGRVEEVARELDVHPQTVRYRLGQLRELFEERLDDPEGRLALSLALRARPSGEPG
jgi:hypothetical protein